MNEHIVSVTCVATHKPDERLRYRLEDADKAFGEFTSSQAKATNVADSAPGQVERFILQGAKKRIGISKTLIQANFDFDGSDKKIDEVLDISIANAKKFYDAALKFHGSNFESHGVITMLGYPVATGENAKGVMPQLGQALAGLFYSGETFGEAHTFELKAGFLTAKKFYRNVALGVYETRGGMAQAGVMVDVNALDLLETGVQLQLDVNDRPRGSEEVAKDSNAFFAVLDDWLAYFKENSFRAKIASLEIKSP